MRNLGFISARAHLIRLSTIFIGLSDETLTILSSLLHIRAERMFSILEWHKINLRLSSDSFTNYVIYGSNNKQI